MPSQEHRNLAGAVIDSLEFAREGRRQAGQVAVRDLARLADQLVDFSGALAWCLQGERTRDGEHLLHLNVEGDLGLRCQRCLGALRFQLQVVSTLRLIKPGATWPEDDLEDDSADAVDAEREMALLPLIEEEVLLALPIAPRHERCSPPAPADKEQEPSPFAVLAKLKK
ncbi:MAG: DUF177 domain-containing protein [Proteobacteria bacterium]|nr:DUF177 domain-containing protein [Pseudomonadota bacterium]